MRKHSSIYDHMQGGIGHSAKALLAATLLGLAIFGLWRGLRSETITVDRLWFYDLNTGQLFPASANAVPPIAAPSDAGQTDRRSGVMATVLRIDGEDQLIVSQLLTYKGADTPVRYLAYPPAVAAGPVQWVAATDPAGMGFMVAERAAAGGKPFTVVFPP